MQSNKGRAQELQKLKEEHAQALRALEEQHSRDLADQKAKAEEARKKNQTLEKQLKESQSATKDIKDMQVKLKKVCFAGSVLLEGF